VERGALIHVIACANVAGLVLARAAARRRELGIRLCLGASRARILGQSLAEPMLLAAFGAAGGIVLARWFSSLVTGMWFMSAMDRGMDARVVIIVALVAAATALLFGLPPALAATRRDPMDVLRSASHTRASDLGRGPRESILIVQAALSLLLLAQAMLLVGKFRKESMVDVGFDDAHVVTARIQAKPGYQRPTDWPQLYSAARERALTVPGVRAAAATGNTPLTFGGWFERVDVPSVAAPADESRSYRIVIVSPGYFDAIGARLAAGREFLPFDRSTVGDKLWPKFDAAVVNESFAKRFWPAGDAVGRTLVFRGAPVRIVGVARDMRDGQLSGVEPRIYFPMLEFAYPTFALVIRVQGDADDAAMRLRAAAAMRLRAALATLPNTEPPVVRTMKAARSDQLQLGRSLGLALSACAAIALLLSAIGLYGAITLWAAGRRAEIGVRIALGARAHHVYSLLIVSAGRFTAIGIAAGVFLALVLIRVERAQYGPSLTMDPTAVTVAVLVFAGVTLLAAMIPARSASRVPPAEVLRST
jgi:putative ABC transport system permease protein